MKTYKVIWFDDEYDSLNILREKAVLNDIESIGYTNAQEGIEELERNIEKYDAAIIDGIFFSSYKQSGTPTSAKSLLNVVLALERLVHRKKLPWFILSGQPSFTRETNPYAEGLKNNQVYDKLNEAHLEKLWSDIKMEADQQIDTQIRHRYHRIFEVCTEQYIGEVAGQDILKLLKVQDTEHIENQFNSIRKILEDLFLAFNKFDLLPAEFVRPNVALNPSSVFLAGLMQGEKTDAVYKQHQHLEETHLPRHISNHLKNILSITQAGSHRSEIDHYVKTLNTPYLLKSVLFQLLDTLVWFKIYVDSNPKTQNWIKINAASEAVETETELIHGKVININPQKGFAFFKPEAAGENVFIPPQLVKNHSLRNGMYIQVEIEEIKDHQTDLIKRKVKRILP